MTLKFPDTPKPIPGETPAQYRDRVLCGERTRTDTERLEWLEKQAKTCTVYMDGTSVYVIAGAARNMRGASFRIAIDEAMNNETP